MSRSIDAPELTEAEQKELAEIQARAQQTHTEGCEFEGCKAIARFKTDTGIFCGKHAPASAEDLVVETSVVEEETQEEKDAEAATEQGDDTDPELAAWNNAAPPEVVEQGKTRDELILERLMDNIFDPDDATKYTKALFYGDLGTSKTVAACDAGGLKVLLVAIESGGKSLRNHPEVMQHVKIMKVKSVNQVELLAEQLQKGALPEYEVIVLDTFSELQKMDLDSMVDVAYAEDSSKARWTPEGKTYQGNTEHLRRIAASFRNVDRNIVFVTHEKEDKDDMSRLFSRADLTPKVAATVGSYVDIIVRFTAEVDGEGNPKFYGQCRPTRGVTAKTRIGALPTIIETPTFKLIHEADQTYTAQEKAKAGNN